VCRRLDRFKLFSNRFSSFVTRTPKGFWYVTRSCVNTLFGDSIGDEEASIGCYD
jgi:hypothetical protein